MGQTTNISWTDATWNIARGCTKVDEDCKFCYMYRDSFNNTRYDPLQVVRTKTVFDMPIRYKETVSKVWSGPPLLFTSSLTDWAHEAIDSYRHEVYDIIQRRPDLIFQMLTKRPERLHKILPEDWGEGWDNVWLGTSVGSQKSIKRMVDLSNIKSKLRFLSIEPLWGMVKLRDAMFFVDKLKAHFHVLPAYDWIIVGGESGNETGKYRYRPCELEWIESIVKECQDNHIPVFVKQLGTHLAKKMGLKDRHGGDIYEWPEHLRIRQMPNVKYLQHV